MQDVCEWLGLALTWYIGLKPGSIDSFGELSKKFQ